MTELRALLERLVRLLDDAAVPFMIAGSFASAAHGLPRTTQDLDVVIDPPKAPALELLVRAMPPDAYYVDADAARDALRRRSMFNVVNHASGWKVVPVFVATPEDPIVAKLEWSQQSGGSEGQRRDVAGIIATLGDQLDRAYVERWVDELVLGDEWTQAQGTPV
jgi:hypothetical protein